MADATKYLVTDATGQKLLRAAQMLPSLENPWFSQPNLLENWYFANPVNQRGQSSYSAGYTVDRWRLTSGSVTLSGDGLVLNGTMEQRMEAQAGGNVTASVLSTTGLNDAAAVYDAENSRLIVTAAGQTIVAVKLELGGMQTLAHQDEDGDWILNEIPDYKSELLKCQRYFQVFGSIGARPSYGEDCRPTMRTASPATGTVSIGGTTYYTLSSDF